MIEKQQDLWSFIDADAICITTNGTIKKNGECVMGRGCAKEAKDLFGIATMLGDRITEFGNRVHVLDNIFPYGCEGKATAKIIVAFPVKHNWFDKADLDLVEKSCLQLRCVADSMGWKKIVVPRPGCGNGQLQWSGVKPILEKYFDDRFIIVSK